MDNKQIKTGSIHFTRHLGNFPHVGSNLWTIVGQDGGQSINLGEKSLFLFSDTLFVSKVPVNHGQFTPPPFSFVVDEPSSFLANCAAITEGKSIREALAQMRFYEDIEGLPRQIIGATSEEQAAGIRFWPGHGLYVDNIVYLFYLGIQQGRQNSMWDFQNLGIGLAILDPVTGDCQRLRRGDDWRFWFLPVDDFHFGVQVLRQGDDCYIFGSVRDEFEIQGFVARVSIDQFTDPDAYQYYQGSSGKWVPDIADAIGLGKCSSEYSVSYNPYLGKYLMVYVDSYEKILWLRTADQITGPFSEPTFIGRVPYESISELVFLAFEHPLFVSEGGRRVYISYSQPYFITNSLVEVCFS